MNAFTFSLFAPLCLCLACGGGSSTGNMNAKAGAGGVANAAGTSGSSPHDGGASASAGSTTGGSSPGGSSGASGGSTTGNGGAASDPCATIKCASGSHCETKVSGGTATGSCVKDDPTQACAADGDCALYRDYCVACDCVVAHSKLAGAPIPGDECTMPVSCLVDACLGKTAQCSAGQCAIQ